MIPKGGFEMKTSRTLISSAMLTAMCDTNSIDNLKLLEKFVAMCIAESTDVGSIIDKSKVLKFMDESYLICYLVICGIQRVQQIVQTILKSQSTGKYTTIILIVAHLMTI